MAGHIFISHAHEDQALAHELRTALEASGTQTWVDVRRIAGGDALTPAILGGIRAARLVLMAFLHRVVNGGGSIEREYAIGRGRMDLCLRMGDVRLAMELKVWRDGRPDPLARAGSSSSIGTWKAWVSRRDGW